VQRLTGFQTLAREVRQELDPLKRSLAGLEATRTYQNWMLGIITVGAFGMMATLVAFLVVLS